MSTGAAEDEREEIIDSIAFVDDEADDDAAGASVVASRNQSAATDVEVDGAADGGDDGAVQQSSMEVVDVASRRQSMIEVSSFVEQWQEGDVPHSDLPDVESMRLAMIVQSTFLNEQQKGGSHPGGDDSTGNASSRAEQDDQQGESARRPTTSGSLRPVTGGGEDGVQLSTRDVPRLKTPKTPQLASRPTTRSSVKDVLDVPRSPIAGTPARRKLPMLMHANSSAALLDVGQSGKDLPKDAGGGLGPNGSPLGRNRQRRMALNPSVMDDKGLSLISMDLRSRSGGSFASQFASSRGSATGGLMSHEAAMAAAVAAERVRKKKEAHKKEMHERLKMMSESLVTNKQGDSISVARINPHDKPPKRDSEDGSGDEDSLHPLEPFVLPEKMDFLSRPLDKSMRIKLPERRTQLLYNDTSFHPHGREKALTAVDKQREDRRAEMYRRKLLGEEKIVGRHVQPRVGMKVMYSFDAVDHHGKPASEIQGVITAVDEDCQMCSVVWPDGADGEEEYCCTGYKERYFLRIIKKDKEYKISEARAWALDAILSPRFARESEGEMWHMSSRYRLIPVPLKEKLRGGKNVLKNVSVKVKHDIREWEKERIKAEEKEAERKKLDKLLRVQKKESKRRAKKGSEEEILLESQFAMVEVDPSTAAKRTHIKESVRNRLREQVVSGEAVSLEDAHMEEVEKLMAGLKFPKLALQTFDDGLPTWMFRPMQPL